MLLLIDDFYLLMICLESTMFFLPENTKYHKGRFVFHGVKLIIMRLTKTQFCSFAMVEGPVKEARKHADLVTLIDFSRSQLSFKVSDFQRL